MEEQRGEALLLDPFLFFFLLWHRYLQSPMNSRPPTGVDLALGLNGFSAKEYPIISKPPRVPTTLQPLDERDYLRRSATLRTREEESQKWERIRMEVEKRRFAEEAEARQATDRALQQKVKGPGSH